MLANGSRYESGASPLPPGPPADLAQHAVAPATGVAAGSHSATPSLHGLRVLVVEDDPDSLDLMVTALGIFGARVTGAKTAAEALAAIDADAPDVVLTDLVMPFVDGFELLGQIRSREEAVGRRIPTAALSARSTAETGATALSAGFEMYVPKPVDPFELAFVVRLLTGGSGRRA